MDVTLELLAISDDADAVWLRLWEDLARGVCDRRSAFHTPALATVAADGTPRVRTVVLRIADPERHVVGCHTRLDTPKVAEVTAGRFASFHVYDAVCKVQVTLSGRARVEHSTPVADARWAATAEASRRCYRTSRPPGTPVASFDPPTTPDDGRSRFAVILCDVDTAEWLWLYHDGHRRWRFTRSGDAWEPTRLAV